MTSRTDLVRQAIAFEDPQRVPIVFFNCDQTEGDVMVYHLSLASGDDPLTAILEELDRWPDERADTIAQEESNRSGNSLAVTVYRLVGVSYLVSVATGASTCPYCLSLDGKRIGIDQYFLQAGENFQPDGAETPLLVTQNRKHAPYHKGCDCITVSG